MLIVNADDWGRSRAETDAAMACHARGTVTSVSAMVFMEDSERAADVAKGVGLDVGLHVNFTQEFTSNGAAARLRDYQDRLARFLKRSKYALVLYHPLLREHFRYVYQMQADEFVRLYDGPPSHVDGHQHMHLCSNMLFDGIIPPGQRVRRSFSFWPGEKNFINRTYRRFVDKLLSRRFRLTDYFFALSHCLRNGCMKRVENLAKAASVELMTHPAKTEEFNWLTSTACFTTKEHLQMGNYTML